MRTQNDITPGVQWNMNAPTMRDSLLRQRTKKYEYAERSVTIESNQNHLPNVHYMLTRVQYSFSSLSSSLSSELFVRTVV